MNEDNEIIVDIRNLNSKDNDEIKTNNIIIDTSKNQTYWQKVKNFCSGNKNKIIIKEKVKINENALENEKSPTTASSTSTESNDSIVENNSISFSNHDLMKYVSGCFCFYGSCYFLYKNINNNDNSFTSFIEKSLEVFNLNQEIIIKSLSGFFIVLVVLLLIFYYKQKIEYRKSCKKLAELCLVNTITIFENNNVEENEE